jgi:hypothetical protein
LRDELLVILAIRSEFGELRPQLAVLFPVALLRFLVEFENGT